MADLDVGMAVGLIKALGSPDPAVIEGAVTDWLDDHPEATTTVQDGSITKAKLDVNLQTTVDDVADLKSEINESQGVYQGMIVWKRGVISGHSIAYNATRIACSDLPSDWLSITAQTGFDIRIATFDSTDTLIGYNDSTAWEASTITKESLQKKYPAMTYAWLQVRKEDNSDFPISNAVGCVEIIVRNKKTFSHTDKYINALDYGFYNYGSVANDSIMADYLTNYYDVPLYFPKGSYLFRNKIEMANGCKFELDNEAEITLESTQGRLGGHFVIFGELNNKRGCYIKGGSINANYWTNSVICLDSIRSARIENCILKNGLMYGIQTARTQDRRASDFYMHNCRIVNDALKTGAIGIYDNAYDNSFDNVTIVGFPIGITTASSKFNRVHAWLPSADYIPNSIGIILENDESCFENCTIDTYHRGVVSRGTNKHYEFNSTNLTFFLNTTVYTSTVAQDNPPIVFHKITTDSFTSYPILHCSNISINDPSYDIQLADFEYPQELINKIWCSGVTQRANIINDGFTVEKRLFTV